MSVIGNPIIIPVVPSGISAQDIIKSAFRKIGVTAKSENASADEMKDALDALNVMIDNWASQGLLCTAQVPEMFPLISGKQSYTIGIGGDFNTSKPTSIESAAYKDSSGIWNGLDVITREIFDSYADRDVVQAPPQALFYDRGVTQQSSQLGTINLYFTPDSSSAYLLKINSVKPFTEFSNFTDPVTFPPSYYAALLWNLALDIFPEYWGPQVPIPALINEKSLETLDDIKAMNAVQVIAAVDLPGAKGGFNIYSGEENS